MKTIKPSSVLKFDGWAPVLEYQNGGRAIGPQRFETHDAAISEAEGMIECMYDYPDCFENNQPNKNQLIDWSNGGAQTSGTKESKTEYTELVEEWNRKAAELEKMADEFFHLKDKESKNRVETKAGVYRACATDLGRLARAVANESKPLEIEPTEEELEALKYFDTITKKYGHLTGESESTK